jgi:hypothetical protein
MQGAVCWKAIPLAALALGALATPAQSSGQIARGVVVDRTALPVPGVVVQLIDSGSHVVARLLTDERGEFHALQAPRPGTYRLRTLRIGFRSTTSDAFALAAGSDTLARLVIASLPIGLDTVRVVGQTACGTLSDSAAIVFALWEQIRTALSATELTAAARNVYTTTMAYERTFDPDGKSIRNQSVTLFSGYLKQPWATAAPDSLHQRGYVLTDRENVTTYFAPGLDMLQSAAFIGDHCFRLIAEEARVGLVFEPAPERRRVPEIRGTLWLDRASAELRSIEFRYANLMPEQEAEARGNASFIRMANGAWAISSWNIRMPALEQRVRSGKMGSGVDFQVAAIHASGGQLVLARRGADTLWAHTPVTVFGMVLDSISRRELVGARLSMVGTGLSDSSNATGRFSISGVLPGEYTLEVHTPSLDSAHIAHRSTITVTDSLAPIEILVPTAMQLEQRLCGPGKPDRPGIIVGQTAMVGDSTASGNIRITASWTDRALAPAANLRLGVVDHRNSTDTRSDSKGAFRLCGLPVGTPIDIAAGDNDDFSRQMVVIAPQSRFARVDLTLVRNQPVRSASAVLFGVVVDSLGIPVSSAEISLPELSKTALTDSSGNFRILDLPTGIHRVLVRHVGLRPIDVQILLSSDPVVARRFELARVPMLDSVIVTETNVDRSMATFEENRRLGLGQFVTRAELAKLEGGVSTSSVMAGLSGIRFARGHSGQAWVVGRNGGRSIGVDKFDQQQGARPTCYAQVFLDNMVAYSGRDGEPLFNINSTAPSEIEAIEYYANPTQTPVKYAALNSGCGVVVIWTRRSR